MTKVKKIILVSVLGVVLMLNFSGVAMAQEEDISFWENPGNYLVNSFKAAASSIWGVLVYGMAFLIGQLGGLVFQLGGFLLEIILDWNDSIQSSPLVTQGWSLLRNLANLGFVLAIIFIAFATMLRIESYGIKRLFVRLVVVAVLINFSLAISGVILNFSDSLTKFFIEMAAGKGEGRAAITSMVENLATTISPQQLLNTDKLTISDYALAFEINEGFFTTLSGLIFASAFTILAAAGVIAIVATGFIRYFVITALLILAPLAWLSFVIPPIDYFKKWWSKLFQWSLFMPTIMFFLYLAIIMADKGAGLRGAENSPYVAIDAAQAGYVGNTLGKIFNDYAGMMLAVATMIMGLMVGEKFSIAGAATGMAFAQMSKNWALGKVREGGRAMNVLRYAPGGGPTVGQRIAAGIAKVPVLGYTFSGATQALDKYSALPKGLVEEKQKEFSGMSDAFFIATLKTRSLSETEAAAAIKELAEKRKKLTKEVLEEVPADQLLSIAQKGANYEAIKDLSKIRPDLAATGITDPDKAHEAIVKAMDAIGGPAAKAELMSDVYKNPSVILSLNTRDIEKITKEADAEVIKQIKETFFKLPFAVRAGREQATYKALEDKILYDSIWQTI